MDTVFIEVTEASKFNHGKFLVGRMTLEEWARPQRITCLESRSLLAARGWSSDHITVMDLQTGEGAMFKPGGYAKADLDKHEIWVCPMFEHFLAWLYKQDLRDLSKLPPVVDLGNVPTAMYGYRRSGRET